MKSIFTILSFVFISVMLSAQPIVSTWVGTGTAGHLSGSNPRATTLLDNPYGVAMDSRGNLWLSLEGGNGFGHEIMLVQPSGNSIVRAGATGDNCFKNASGITSKFSQPRGMDVDANDNIYVADFGNNVIRKISKFMSIGNAQVVSTYAGKNDSTPTSSCYQGFAGYVNGTLKNAQFNGPSDIAIDKTTGAMYVADAMNHCIRKIYQGQVTTVAGHPDSIGFKDGAVGIAKFNYPTGVYLASNGDLYVADHNNQCIRKISGTNVTTVVPAAKGLWTPDDVWVLSNGDIVITDQHRIRLYSGTTLTTFAGSTAIPEFGDVDGYGTTARFNYVKCLIADNAVSGVYFVADQSNHKIRRMVQCASYKPVITITGGQQKSDSSWSTCTGDTIYLEVKAAYNSYKWSTGPTTSKIFVKSTTSNITCTVTNSDGCIGISDNYDINISDLKPTITATGPTTFCPGDSVILLGPNGYNNYKWTKDGSLFEEGPAKQSILVHSPDVGVYVLTGTLGYCTGSSNPVTVATSSSIVPEIKILKGSANLCQNDTLLVEVIGTYDSYQWKKDGVLTSTTKSLTITSAGDYTVSVTQSGGCSGTSNVMKVTIISGPPVPTFTVSHDTLWSSAANAYQWYFNNQKITGAQTRGYIATQSGSYFVEVTDTTTGCKSRSLPQNVVLSILEFDNGLRFDVYPNPTKGKLYLSADILQAGNVNIRIVNMMGKVIYEEYTPINPGRFEKNIDLQGNPAGMYMVLISNNNKQGSLKLILK